MGKPFLVFEDLSVTPRKVLFHLLGTRWEATRLAWLSPFFWCALGVSIAFLSESTAVAVRAVACGVGYGLLLLTTNLIHSIGHVVAGRVIGAPMVAVVVTATRDVAVYVTGGAAAPPRKRVLRSLGGPVANLAVAALAFTAGTALASEWLRMFALFNILIGAWTLLPVPTLDGAVIWGALCKGDRS